MLKRILFIILIATVGLLNAVPVLAATTAIVSILGIPAYSGGILSFNVIYTSDTQMNLNWTVGGGVANVMVRAKYGSYPSNPPNTSTAPSDGYLVYYGSDLSAIDTSMDMNQNAGTLYYSAWAQHADGSWYVVASTKSEESKEMILLSFIGLFIGLLVVNVMARNSFTPIKLMAALAWVIPLMWVIGNPPSFITAGSGIQNAIIVVLIGMLLICAIAAFRRQLNVNIASTNKKTGVFKSEESEGSGWHLPTFMSGGNSEEQQIQQIRESRKEKLIERRKRFREALRGEEDDR